MLDVLGVDARVILGWHGEDEGLLGAVFCRETVTAIRRYHGVWQGVRRHGVLRCAVEADVYWWGRVNPRGVVLKGVGVERGGEVVTVHGPFYGGGVVGEGAEMEGEGTESSETGRGGGTGTR